MHTNTNVTTKFGAHACGQAATIFDWRATRAWFRTGGYPGRNPINRKRLFVRMKKSLPRGAPARADKPRRIVSPAAIRQNRNGVNSISRFQTRSTYAPSQPLALALALVLILILVLVLLPCSPILVLALVLVLASQQHKDMCTRIRANVANAHGCEDFSNAARVRILRRNIFNRLSDNSRFFVIEYISYFKISSENIG